MALLISLAVDLFIVGGVIWPYLAQAKKMRAEKDGSSFNTKASLILLASAILRIFYYVSLPADAKFGYPLLIQAVATIVVQMYMIHVVLSLKYDTKEIVGAAIRRIRPERNILDFKLEDFWQWTDFLSYTLATMSFSVFCLCATGMFINQQWLPRILGSLSLGIEALLPVPQILTHYNRKSTAGFSYALIGAWFFGDGFKILYAVARNEPLPFLLCGAFQFFCDCIILFQMLMLYKKFDQNVSINLPQTDNLDDSGYIDGEAFTSTSSPTTPSGSLLLSNGSLHRRIPNAGTQGIVGNNPTLQEKSTVLSRSSSRSSNAWLHNAPTPRVGSVENEFVKQSQETGYV